MTGKHPQFVRCKDATLVRDVVSVGEVYQCQGAQDDLYLVKGLWLTKGRFEPATYAEWIAGK